MYYFGTQAGGKNLRYKFVTEAKIHNNLLKVVQVSPSHMYRKISWTVTGMEVSMFVDLVISVRATVRSGSDCVIGERLRLQRGSTGSCLVCTGSSVRIRQKGHGAASCEAPQDQLQSNERKTTAFEPTRQPMWGR